MLTRPELQAVIDRILIEEPKHNISHWLVRICYLSAFVVIVSIISVVLYFLSSSP